MKNDRKIKNKYTFKITWNTLKQNPLPNLPKETDVILNNRRKRGSGLVGFRAPAQSLVAQRSSYELIL